MTLHSLITLTYPITPGRIVLLNNDNYNSILVSYKSYKSRRVARSVLSVEVIALADLFDNELAIRKQLKSVLRRPIPIRILTDSKSLFDIKSKEVPRADKRIILDIYVYMRLKKHIKQKK